ncbi:MAG: hypothetical protein R2712_00775 [Vicinamibacterales bacterium]
MSARALHLRPAAPASGGHRRRWNVRCGRALPARRTVTGLVSSLTARAADTDGLSRLRPVDLDDGPWCPDAWSSGRFDADLLRVRRIDIHLRVEARSARFRGPAGILFSRGGTAARNTPSWVADRRVTASVTLEGR